MASIVVTGIVGGLSQLVAARLLEAGHQVVGVDYRPSPPDLHRDVLFYQANYNKTRIEDVFRRHKPEIVLHLGRVGNLKERVNKRFDLNVVGSAKLMELSVKYGADRLVVLSTFHIYGAHPHNHIPIHEDEPLRAGTSFPQLGDAVQLDNQASTWIYRHRELKTVVLRPTNVVGTHIHNAISQYLRLPTVLYMLGFNPMWQFVHELDMVDAILLAAHGEDVGVFNVAGRGAVPLREALQLTGARVLPMPGALAHLALRVQNTLGAALPTYLLDFFKYPCVISDAAFRKSFGYEARIGIAESIRTTAGAGTARAVA